MWHASSKSWWTTSKEAFSRLTWSPTCKLLMRYKHDTACSKSKHAWLTQTSFLSALMKYLRLLVNNEGQSCCLKVGRCSRSNKDEQKACWGMGRASSGRPRPLSKGENRLRCVGARMPLPPTVMRSDCSTFGSLWCVAVLPSTCCRLPETLTASTSAAIDGRA